MEELKTACIESLTKAVREGHDTALISALTACLDVLTRATDTGFGKLRQ